MPIWHECSIDSENIMNAKSLLNKVAAGILAGVLCLGFGTMSFAVNGASTGVVTGAVTRIATGAMAEAAIEAAATNETSKKMSPRDGSVSRVVDGATKSTGAEKGNSHWSAFNLVAALTSLLIALIVVAHLGISSLRNDQAEAEAWERLKNPETLDDIEEAVSRYEKMMEHPENITTFEKRSTAFNQLCTSVCVGLAVVGIIVFFIVGRFDTPMVLFDALTPLFIVLFVLTLLGAVLSLLCGSGVLKFGKRNKGSAD
jgi:hypothetical protein